VELDGTLLVTTLPLFEDTHFTNMENTELNDSEEEMAVLPSSLPSYSLVLYRISTGDSLELILSI
jgi:hypothetical protein